MRCGRAFPLARDSIVGLVASPCAGVPLLGGDRLLAVSLTVPPTMKSGGPAGALHSAAWVAIEVSGFEGGSFFYVLFLAARAVAFRRSEAPFPGSRLQLEHSCRRLQPAGGGAPAAWRAVAAPPTTWCSTPSAPRRIHGRTTISTAASTPVSGGAADGRHVASAMEVDVAESASVPASASASASSSSARPQSAAGARARSRSPQGPRIDHFARAQFRMLPGLFDLYGRLGPAARRIDHCELDRDCVPLALQFKGI